MAYIEKIRSKMANESSVDHAEALGGNDMTVLVEKSNEHLSSIEKQIGNIADIISNRMGAKQTIWDKMKALKEANRNTMDPFIFNTYAEKARESNADFLVGICDNLNRVMETVQTTESILGRQAMCTMFKRSGILKDLTMDVNFSDVFRNHTGCDAHPKRFQEHIFQKLTSVADKGKEWIKKDDHNSNSSFLSFFDRIKAMHDSDDDNHVHTQHRVNDSDIDDFQVGAIEIELLAATEEPVDATEEASEDLTDIELPVDDDISENDTTQELEDDHFQHHVAFHPGFHDPFLKSRALIQEFLNDLCEE